MRQDKQLSKWAAHLRCTTEGQDRTPPAKPAPHKRGTQAPAASSAALMHPSTNSSLINEHQLACWWLYSGRFSMNDAICSMVWNSRALCRSLEGRERPAQRCYGFAHLQTAAVCPSVWRAALLTPPAMLPCLCFSVAVVPPSPAGGIHQPLHRHAQVSKVGVPARQSQHCRLKNYHQSCRSGMRRMAKHAA